MSLSPTPVRRRIKRLESAGLIRRYTVDIDMEKAGYGLSVYVFVKLQGRDQVTIAEFEQQIEHVPEISHCALVTGAHDYILTLNVPDMDSYNRLLRSVLAELPGVFGIETSLVISKVKQQIPLPS